MMHNYTGPAAASFGDFHLAHNTVTTVAPIALAFPLFCILSLLFYICLPGVLHLLICTWFSISVALLFYPARTTGPVDVINFLFVATTRAICVMMRH